MHFYVDYVNKKAKAFDETKLSPNLKYTSVKNKDLPFFYKQKKNIQQSFLGLITVINFRNLLVAKQYISKFNLMLKHGLYSIVPMTIAPQDVIQPTEVIHKTKL